MKIYRPSLGLCVQARYPRMALVVMVPHKQLLAPLLRHHLQAGRFSTHLFRPHLLDEYIFAHELVKRRPVVSQCWAERQNVLTRGTLAVFQPPFQHFQILIRLLSLHPVLRAGLVRFFVIITSILGGSGAHRSQDFRHIHLRECRLLPRREGVCALQGCFSYQGCTESCSHHNPPRASALLRSDGSYPCRT